MSRQTDHFLIGVDGGGSGCRAVLADATGRVLARGRGGPANISGNVAIALANIRSALDQAVQSAGIAPDCLRRAHAHLGLAGVMSPADSANVAPHFGFARCVVTDDRPTALAGALAGGDGVVLAVGTGTFVARALGGQAEYVGGWGAVAGDQASGAWLGRGAVEQVLLAQDGLRAHSDLTGAVLARFGNDPVAMARWTLAATPAEFAALAPAVMAAARAGDPLGVALMQQGADYLSHAMTRLGRDPVEAVCAIGGVARHYAPFLPDAVRACLVDPKGSALDGALFLAAGQVAHA